MLDPYDSKDIALMRRLARKRRLSWLSIMAERITLHFWRPVLWVLLFVSLWLLQVPFLFGQIPAIGFSALFILGLAYLSYTDIRGLRSPSEDEIDRRLERASSIRHNPIRSIKDRLANPQKEETQTLWESRKQYLRNILPQIRAPRPAALLARRDPRAVRALILLLFCSAALIAGRNWQDNLLSGLIPINTIGALKSGENVRLWVTPPEYTALGQTVLEGSGRVKETIKIPTGSVVKILVHGGLGHPHVHLGDKNLPMALSENKSYALETAITDGNSLSIRQWMIPRLSLRYEVIPDLPPGIKATKLEESAEAGTFEVERSEEMPPGPPGSTPPPEEPKQQQAQEEDPALQPQITQNGTLRFPLTVYDDYGVQNLYMRMDLDGLVEAPPLGQSVEEVRSVISSAAQDLNIQPVYDMTAHTWAGLPVVFHFEAEDAIGQKAALEPVKMILPERKFEHPVARVLIALRKQLAWNPDGPYEEIYTNLQALLTAPGQFQNDIVVYLAIRTAAARLVFADPPGPDTARPIIDLLWDTALRVEDGNLSLAARNLRDAQMALEDALRNPETTEEEISELMHALKQAMAEYMMEMQKEMQKRMANGQDIPIMPQAMMNALDMDSLLNDFMAQMENEMREGNKGAAQEMLSQLQRMLDMMDPSMMAGMPADMEMMEYGINELQQLIERQEALLEQTQIQAGVPVGTPSLPGPDVPTDFGRILEPNENLADSWGLDSLPPQPSAPNARKENPQARTPESAVNTQLNKTEQEALRLILGQLMLDAAEELDEIPENMGLAEQEMRLSSTALGDNNPADSLPHQELALKYLKEAQQQLNQMLMARMQQIMMISFNGRGDRSPGYGQYFDPLGRPYGGHGDQDGQMPGSRVEVPDEAEKKRVEEILKLLRQRSGELDRPDEELQYYRRLLRRF